MKHLIFQSRLVVLLLGFLTFGISHAWGADPTASFNKNDFSSSKKTCTKSSITVTLDEVTLNGDQIRWTSGKKCVISSSAGKISKIEVTTNSTEKYISPMGGSVSSGSWTKSTSTKYVWTGDASSVTLTANDAVRITTITVTYSAAAPTSPSLTPSATSLAFGSVESGTNKSLSTLNVAGANLTDNITFDITGTNASYFTVTNPSSISKGTGTVSETPITIQYAPETTGNHTATLQIKSTGADTKEVTLTGRGSGKGEIFYESFDENDGTGGNDNKWDGSIASNDLKADNEGWTFTKGGGANKCAKFGTGSALGSAETPELSYTGSATLTFNAAAWNGNSESTTLKLSATNATLSESSVTLTKGAWDNFEITVTDIKEGAKIKFEGNSSSNSRFFLDEVLLVAVPTAKTVSVEVAEGQSAMGSATINGGTDPIEIEGDGEEEFTFEATPNEGYLFSYWSSTGDIILNNDYDNPVVGSLATETSVVTAHFVKKSSMSATPTKIEKSAYVGEDDCYGEVVINFHGSDIVLHSSVTFLIDPVTSFANDDAEFELDAYSQIMNYTDLNKNVTLTYAGYTEGTYKVNVVATAYDLKSNETGSVTVPVTLTIANRTQAHVTFDANGKTLTGDLPAAVDYDLTEQTLPEVAATGYTFQGWNTDKDATTGLTTFTPIEAKTYTLYAIWSANSYDVIFNKNNEAATGEMENLTIKYKESANLTANNYELTGYEFQGWATTADGEVAYANGVNYTMNTADNVNLYAVWKAETYTITYMDGDKEYTPTTGMPTTHTYGTATPLEDGSKAGYSFDGWYKESTLDNKVETIGATEYTDNITLYAKWTMIVPTSWSFDKTELTLVWNDNNNKIGYATPTIEPADAYNEVSYSKIVNDDVVSISNVTYNNHTSVLKVTAKKEGTATYLAKADGNSELTQVITITVKSLPKITWLNADGSVFATTSATALVDGTVGALPPVDADHQPITCDEAGGYTTFMGWSKHAFRAQGDAPTDYVQTTDPVGESGATFYAVFAKVEGEDKDPEFQKYEAVTTAPADWSGTYIMVVDGKIVEIDGGKTASMKAATSFNTTTEVAGKEVVVAKTTSGYSIFLKENEKYLSKSTSNTNTSLAMESSFVTSRSEWILSTTSIQSVSANTRYIMLNSSTVGTYLSSQSGAKYVILYKRVETAGSHAEIKGYLSSCCEGKDITLVDNGEKTGGKFSADVTSACAGDEVTLSANANPGYSFGSWSVNNGDITVTNNQFTMPDPAIDITVDATFTANTHDVLLQKNDGSGDYATQVFTFDVPQKIQKNTFERTGYKFNGWSTTSEGSVEYADEAEYTLTVDKNVQLYAVWTADDAVAVSVQGTEHLSDITAPTSISAKAKNLSFTYSVATGYKVDGVTVTIDGTPVTEGVSFTQTNFSLLSDADFAGAIVITFDVQEILNTITLNPGSGTCEKTEVKQTAYGAAVTLPTPTIAAEGWTFAGWADAKVVTETETAPTLYTGTYTPAENLTLFAVYKRGEEVESTTEKYVCDFEGTSAPTGWSFTNFSCTSDDAIEPHSGSKWGKVASSSAAYVTYNTELTGKYKITAYVARTSTNDAEGPFSIKTSANSWGVTLKTVNVKNATVDQWQELSWQGDLDKVKVEIYYKSTSTAVRALDDITIVKIIEKNYYHSTPSVLTSLTVSKKLAKNTNYKVGEVFNPEGIELQAIYDNDESTAEPITEGFDYEPKTALAAGVTTITLTYKKATCTLDVTAGTLDHISITTKPSKLDYVEGECFSNASLVTRAYYKYNDAEICSEALKKDVDLTYSPSLTTPLTTSDTYVRIFYTWAGTTVYVDQPITVIGKVATPTFDPAGGKLSGETPITISCATEGASIFYTTDGTDPTTESEVYTEPVKMIGGTLKAIATAENMGQSEVGKAVFIETIDPTNGDWMLVTDVSDLAEGDYLIIASNAKGWVAGKEEGQNLAHITTTFSDDKSILTYTADAMMFRLGGETGAWTLTNVDKEHLMGATAEKKLSWDNGTTTWSITIDNINNATIQNGSDYGRMLDNTGNYFTTYKSATSSSMLLPQLYKYYKAVPKLIYDANGGENAPVPTRSENGVATVTDKTPTWGGYEFVQWTENQDGSGKVYTANEEVALTADLTIYAQWQEKQLEGTPMALVVQYNDKYYAMGKDLSAVEVEDIYNGNVVVVSEEIDQKAITWYRKDVEGGVTFQNCEEMYLQGAYSTNLELVEDITEATIWNWDNENQYYYTTIAGTKRSFFSQNGTFKNYAVSNIGTGSYSSAATCCTSFRVGEVFTRDMSNGNMGTHCYPFDIAAGDYKGAQFYEIAYRIGDTRIYFDQVDHVEAGVPYLVVPEDEENGSVLEAIVTRYTESDKPASTNPEDNNGFIGSYTQQLLTQVADNLYIVYNNEFRLVGTNVSVGANRAYIDLSYVSTNDPQQGKANAPRRISLRNSNAQSPTGIDNVVAEFGDSKEAKKVIVNGNFYIINQGNVYGAQGQLVK